MLCDPQQCHDNNAPQSEDEEEGSVTEILLVNIDHYMDTPTLADCTLKTPYNISEKPLDKVPVVRIFGITRSKQRVCLHIHQVWPYIYVRYTGSENVESVLEFGYQIGQSLNHALNMSYKRESAQYIAAVVPVKGVPFYGYCAGYRPFLKILFANPGVIGRANTLLTSGAIMSRKIDTFAAHLPYTLQFLVDYNLYGMDWVQLRKAKLLYRDPLPNPLESDICLGRFSESTISPECRWVLPGIPNYLLKPGTPTKASTCELEVDATAESILNRGLVEDRHTHHVFREDGLVNTRKGKLVHSLGSIWSDESQRRLFHGLDALQPKHNDQEAASAARSQGRDIQKEWASYWRMSSLLHSALVVDKERSCKMEAKGMCSTDHTTLGQPCELSWMEGWPNCREVDVADKSFMLDVNGSDESGCGQFYSKFIHRNSNAQMLASQQSDSLLTGNGGDPSHSAQQSLSSWAVSVDADLVSQSQKKYDEHFINGSEVEDGSESDTGSLDLLSDCDTEWIHNEVIQVEHDYLSGSKPLPLDEPENTKVPQNDGGSDGGNGYGSSDSWDRSIKNQGSSVIKSKDSRNWKRSLAPLSFSSSIVAMNPVTSEPLCKWPLLDIPRKRSERMDEKQHYMRIHRRRRRVILTSDDEESDSITDSTEMSRKDDTAVIYKHKEVVIDIPHREGTYAANASNHHSTRISNGIVPYVDIVVPPCTSLPLEKSMDDYMVYSPKPPSCSALNSTLSVYGIPEVVCPGPKNAVFDQNEYIASLQVFNPQYAQPGTKSMSVGECAYMERSQRRQLMWSREVVKRWTDSYLGLSDTLGGNGWWQFVKSPPRILDLMPGEASEFPSSETCQDLPEKGLKKLAYASQERIRMTQISMELLPDVCQGVRADPRRDRVLCIAICILDQTHGQYAGDRMVLWSINGENSRKLTISKSVENRHMEDEYSMLVDVAEWTRMTDPDLICGYEMNCSSWGYLIERAEIEYKFPMTSQLSRLTFSSESRYNSRQYPMDQGHRNSWDYRKGAAVKLVGRHALNIWRLMRSELNLASHTFEAVAKQVLDIRSPLYSASQLATWYRKGPTTACCRSIRHLLFRARADLQILAKTGIIDRAVEFASVIGIDFNSVLTRGSQFRVESLMARIAHPELFILSSPTREQVAQQRAAECLPLVLEPQSNYYTDPVVVLDFRSLYPSIMIAYNYCFSTCLGSVEQEVAGGIDNNERQLGFTSTRIAPGLLDALKSDLTVSPNGILFVKPSVRKGLLGRMLEELLESRVMVKDSMKLWESSSIDERDKDELHKKMDARQLGLKLIANVTYGYAGASFSGRMPCVELADAIVQTSRETLEDAIQFIHSNHAKWGARVVYGDTDSMFIHLPGKSRKSAFRIGQEIADAVTQRNPAPVNLKLEKVYQPSLMLTKKRYAGWMYTSPNQETPGLDVKGMELVRRDGCPVMQRVLEGTIDTLFRTNDLKMVREYVVKEVARVMRGEVALQEFIIAKEVRIGTYSSNNNSNSMPAHAKVASDAMENDESAKPQYGERVPYVVVYGVSGRHARLMDQVVQPQVLLARPDIRLNYKYYIEKQIVPALDRVLSLAGADVRKWISGMSYHLRGNTYASVLDDYYCLAGENDDAIGSSEILSSDSEDDSSDDSNDDSEQPNLDPVAAMVNKKRQIAQHCRTLDQFYQKRICLVCQCHIAPLPSTSFLAKDILSKKWLPPVVCNLCAESKPGLAAELGAIYLEVSRSIKETLDICAGCVGGPRMDTLVAAQTCESLDCPIMFKRTVLNRRYKSLNQVTQRLANLLS